MFADMPECPAWTWLAMIFLSAAGMHFLLLLVLTVAALARYVLTGRGIAIGRGKHDQR